jgi:hypothetical protein
MKTLFVLNHWIPLIDFLIMINFRVPRVLSFDLSLIPILVLLALVIWPSRRKSYSVQIRFASSQLRTQKMPPDNLLLDSVPNLGPLISHWELDKFKNC